MAICNYRPTNTKVSKVPGKSEGLKITLKVMAGDTIEISAKAFYNMDKKQPGKSVNIAPIIGAALAAMTNPIGSVGTAMGEGSQLANDLGAATSTAAASQSAGLFSIPQKNDQNNLVYPKSGINFVLYNSRFDVVDENTGYLPVDDHINAIQNLATDRLVMKESGYLEVFVNNDAQTPVYYDNLRVSHSAGSVMEVNAYYPYGKLIAGLSEQSTYAKNRYKYNEKEYIEELDLNWSDFGARMLDIQWMVTDPLAEKYYSISPYAYCANNPIRFIDPDGRKIRFADNVTFGQKARTIATFSGGWIVNKQFRQNLNTAIRSSHINIIVFKNTTRITVAAKQRYEHNKLRPEAINFFTATQSEIDAFNAESNAWNAYHDQLNDHYDIEKGDGTMITMGYGDKYDELLQKEGINNMILWSHEMQHVADMNRGLYNDKSDGWSREEILKYNDPADKRALESQNSMTRSLNRLKRNSNKYRYRDRYHNEEEEDGRDVWSILNSFLMQNPNIRVF